MSVAELVERFRSVAFVLKTCVTYEFAIYDRPSLITSRARTKHDVFGYFKFKFFTANFFLTFLCVGIQKSFVIEVNLQNLFEYEKFPRNRKSYYYLISVERYRKDVGNCFLQR